MKIKDFIFLGLIVFFGLLLRLLIFYNFDLTFSYLFLSLGIINGFLFFYIGKKFFNKQIALILSILYFLSPWPIYLEINQSFYIFSIFLGLLFSVFAKKRDHFFVTLLLSLSIISSFLIFLDLRNRDLFIFNIGLINAVNQLQGELSSSGVKFLKVFENKYTYFSLNLLFNYLGNLSPAVYFTPQAKMLGFSNLPPVVFGFLLFFIMGIFSLGKYVSKKIILLLVFISIGPSAWSKFSPDLERLALVMPILFLIIALGIEKLKDVVKFKKIILFGFLIITVFQYLVIIADVLLREVGRINK